MRVRVSVRINADTGEFELFQVDDLGSTRLGEDHDAIHDQIAYEAGRVLDPRPETIEVIDDVLRTDNIRRWGSPEEMAEEERQRDTLENG